MGLFAHEAAAVDPEGKTVYLTQDNALGLLYRYTPTNYPDLRTGLLEAALVAPDGAVTWAEVPDPSAATTPTRDQVPGATVFPGGEGIWYHDGFVYFTTKYDHSVHSIDLAEQRHRVIWKGDPDGKGIEGAVLSHVDNITVDDGSGDLFVAEDGANMEVVIITPEGAVAPFVRITGAEHEGSEVTGPCFNPAGDRLYFSSQRGPTEKPVSEIIPGAAVAEKLGGVTYEVTGPFRGAEAKAEAEGGSSTLPSPVTTLGQAGGTEETSGSGDDDSNAPLLIGGGVAVVAAAAGGLIAVRRRRSAEGDPTL
jgi:secreted PhoX family phosphatase